MSNRTRQTVIPRLVHLAAAVLMTAATVSAAALVEQTNLWCHGVDGYPTYRIPALLVTPDWTWVVTDPGIGIRLCRDAHKGRLVIPCDDKREFNSHMLFSDDRGRTWQFSRPIQAR